MSKSLEAILADMTDSSVDLTSVLSLLGEYDKAAYMQSMNSIIADIRELMSDMKTFNDDNLSVLEALTDAVAIIFLSRKIFFNSQIKPLVEAAKKRNLS